MESFAPGLYDLLNTEQLQAQLRAAGLLDRADWSPLELEAYLRKLPVPLAKAVARFLQESVEHGKAGEQGQALAETLTDGRLAREVAAMRPHELRALQAIRSPGLEQQQPVRPTTPVSESALLTGASRGPALRTELQKELASCDRADWLVSFIKYAGLLPLLDTLRAFTQVPAPDGGPRLRVATTSYMGATDARAIEALLELDNTEVRVSYDTKRTRLHAKAYLFHRATGFSSAYIGSANVSKVALDEGLEWTAKVSQYETEHLWRHAVATFESHWEDGSEFRVCRRADLAELRAALRAERGEVPGQDAPTYFDIRPYDYQQAILEAIGAERDSGRRRHLVIAATGTGKTLVAAFDYRSYAAAAGGRPRLLFVAHREEILKHACAAFRQVLRDGSFGDVVTGGANVDQWDHLFCTVQSWHSRRLDRFSPEHFDYVVLDEAHHATAETYRQLVQHVRPKCLLGLTATPERTDGGDIRDDFGGAFTHEIRLPEAIERALLTPFHYYGIPDLEGVDFSGLEWRRGGYDRAQLSAQLEANRARADWVMAQTERYVTDIARVRGLGFCVSIAHAEFMARVCREKGIAAAALSADTPQAERREMQRRLTEGNIRFLFTVDLYNEGVDIPSVDTVLFLRPTESLIVFLQQLGRGLRLHDDKSHLTVLDFIAPQHRSFRYSRRFQALTTCPEIRIDRQVRAGMPYVPTGCVVHLERKAQTRVLESIRKEAANLRGRRLLDALRDLRRAVPGPIPLHRLLDLLYLDEPDELYKAGLPHVLLEQADRGVVSEEAGAYQEALKGGFRRLCTMDDTNLLGAMRDLLLGGATDPGETGALVHSVLWGTSRLDMEHLSEVHAYVASRPGLRQDLLDLLEWSLANRTPLPRRQMPA